MDRWITDWERSEPDWLPYYTRANAGETLPDPASPLNWTFVWEQGFVPGWVRAMEEMGIYRVGQFPREKPAQLGMFAGYFYINLSHIRLMLIRLGVPADAVDLAFVGKRSDVPPYVPHPRDEDPGLAEHVAATLGGIFGRTGWPEVDERLAAATARRRNRPDLRAHERRRTRRPRPHLPAAARGRLALALLDDDRREPRPRRARGAVRRARPARARTRPGRGHRRPRVVVTLGCAVGAVARDPRLGRTDRTVRRRHRGGARRDARRRRRRRSSASRPS